MKRLKKQYSLEPNVHKGLSKEARAEGRRIVKEKGIDEMLSLPHVFEEQIEPFHVKHEWTRQSSRVGNLSETGKARGERKENKAQKRKFQANDDFINHVIRIGEKAGYKMSPEEEGKYRAKAAIALTMRKPGRETTRDYHKENRKHRHNPEMYDKYYRPETIFPKDKGE